MKPDAEPSVKERRLQDAGWQPCGTDRYLSPSGNSYPTQEAYRIMRLLTKEARRAPSVQCQHAATHEGPRCPLRYGSAATEVCDSCGYWRTMHHMPGPWESPPIPQEKCDA
jgi:hypothetical protein